MKKPEYMIRNTLNNLFSNGIVRPSFDWIRHCSKFEVRFNERGKIWRSEKLLKQHLLKCVKKRIPTEHWEIVEVQYTPTKPLYEWFDEKMTLSLLK
jgi:hypothetical protein